MPSFLVVGDHGLGLMFSPPQRPGEDEGLLCGLSHHEAHDQRSNFGDGGDQGDFAHQAAIAGFGLVSFGLPRAERRRSAPRRRPGPPYERSAAGGTPEWKSARGGGAAKCSTARQRPPPSRQAEDGSQGRPQAEAALKPRSRRSRQGIDRALESRPQGDGRRSPWRGKSRSPRRRWRTNSASRRRTSRRRPQALRSDKEQDNERDPL